MELASCEKHTFCHASSLYFALVAVGRIKFTSSICQASSSLWSLRCRISYRHSATQLHMSRDIGTRWFRTAHYFWTNDTRSLNRFRFVLLQDTSDLLYVKSVRQWDAEDASYCNYRFYSRHLNTGPKIKLNILKLHQVLVGPFIGSIQLYLRIVIFYH